MLSGVHAMPALDPFLPKLTCLILGNAVDHASRSDDASGRAQALRRVARMRLRTSTFSAALLFGLLHGQFAMGSDRFPTTDWERVDPEGAGWSRQKLEKAERWSRQIKSIAVMVVHHGLVVAEWGDIVGKTELASVRKSLLSALIGIAVERKELELSRTIGSLGIDDNEPSLTPQEKSATVRDLLQSRSGVYHAALYEARAAADARPARHSHKPGAFWYYNNWDFNTLGTIYERAARSSIFDAFEREIARPIGMQDYQPRDGRYIAGEASVYPAYPIKMSARDLARFALLYLNKGRWQDRQIIPAAWVEESTKVYSNSDLGAGYGYMWWTAPISNGVAPSVSLPDGTFYAAGTGGQYAFVIPTYDLVVVHRAPHPDGGVDLRTVGRLLWLLLDAGRFPDIGPDASLEAAQGMRASGDVLSRMLMGKTLLYGEANATGPYRIRLNLDGSAAFLRGSERVEADTGTWSIREDQFCREWKKLEPRQRCLAAVSIGSKIQLFDPMGLMLIEARVVEE
jgi:CubicO group peptidase (beta-lactamase class C family)